jgi:hypothetical protein
MKQVLQNYYIDQQTYQQFSTIMENYTIDSYDKATALFGDLGNSDASHLLFNAAQMTWRFAVRYKLNVVGIHSFADVLHNGWEMDNLAWVVDLDDETKLLLTSDHGGVCDLSKRELVNKINETALSLQNLIRLAKVLDEEVDLSGICGKS